MESNSKIVYSAPVVEFLAVAKEYCQFLAGVQQYTVEQFIDKLQKFIPLLYLKGAMLPLLDGTDIEGDCEDFVTEDEYNDLFFKLKLKIGEYDDYLEIVDNGGSYYDEPVVQCMSEKIADIYQDMKNFVETYRSGVENVMYEALWQLSNNFELYWGKNCAELLRIIHSTKFKISLFEDSDDNLDAGYENSEDEFGNGVEDEF